ncbi:MAG: heavy-metal-associated domain-containing protein [Bacteroidales bacterium]|nr:heavy-metal-associated domain-containing protein [Bacteroidales bacterium]
MKITSFLIAGVFALFSFSQLNGEPVSSIESETNKATLKGGEKTTFKVYGNCGMCENRIEKTAKSMDGVTSAKWDKESEMLTITYDPDKVELMSVHKALAEVGHDTKKVKADDKTYSGLPGCCKYRD